MKELLACMARHCWVLSILLFTFQAASQPAGTGPSVKLVSWNIQHFGASKSDLEIERIAAVLRHYHLAAVQEVATGPAGAQAAAKLAAALNRSGSRWQYFISEATSSQGQGQERYALFWQPAKLSLEGRPFLCSPLANVIEREPLLARFRWGQRRFTVVVFHALPKAKQPETELKYFRQLPGLYPNDSLLFAGDFNLPSAHSVFLPLQKMGYTSATAGQKTSLRHTCIQNNCMASEYDHWWYPGQWWRVKTAGVDHFYQNYPFDEARKLSDHCPVFIELY